jgi:hypothetical protein
MKALARISCATFLFTGVAGAATAAPVTLVCDTMLDSFAISDSPTVLYLDEDARTVSGHLGAYRDHPDENPEAEEPLNNLPATFTQEEIVFSPPGFLVSFHLNRLTGTLLPLDKKTGERTTGGRKCHVQQKQF